MDKEQIERFEKLKAQILGVYEEVSALSKKSPDKAVNKFKLKFINDILICANGFLGEKYKALDEFEKFEIESLPSNSDIIFIISQYLKCLKKYNEDNATLSMGSWYWRDSNGNATIKASNPSHFETVKGR